MTLQRRRYKTVASHWPHIGVVVGIVLNMVGLSFGQPDLIATGSNVLTLSGLYLAQRHRNRKE